MTLPYLPRVTEQKPATTRTNSSTRMQRCSAADQPVVLGMTTDPEPMNAGIGRQAQGSVVETNSHSVEPATGQKLELE